MNRQGSRWFAVAAFVALLAGSGVAGAVELDGGVYLDADVDAAVQERDVSGSLEKFQEYGDVRKGFVLNDLRLDLGGTGKGYLVLEARDALQNDARYRLTGGRHGKYRVNFLYDSTPHNFSGGRFLWGGFGTGRLQIADVVQGQLQANEQTQVERGPPSTDPNQDTTGEDAIRQDIVRGLYDAANDVAFRLRREQTNGSFEYNLTEDVAAWVRVENENRRGARVVTTGTYERWNQGSGLGHIQDRFVVAGADLAEPIDYGTLGVSAGVGVRKKRWLADLEYTFTSFRNSNAVLHWDNPFRITDAAASGATGGFDRGRFVVGQLVLPQSSEAHDLTASAAIDVPLNGRLAVSVSFGLISQDEEFAPYTLNSAIQASDASGPLGPASTLSLPQRDLDGQVRTWAGSASLGLRPVERVDLNARYQLYTYDSRTPEIHFPGYAGFGESFWRRVRNDPGAEVVNETFDYTRHNAELGVDVRIASPLTVSLNGGWEGHDFKGLRIDRMNEFGVGAGLLYRPGRNTRVRASYRYSDRSTDPYLPGATAENPEARGLVNFNWAERRRHRATVSVQASPLPLVSFGIQLSGMDDKYSGDSEGTEEIDRFRFGRTHLQSATGAVDVTLTPGDRVSVYASYAREYREEKMSNAAKDDGPKDVLGLGDQFTAINYWNSNIYERVNTVGVGATVGLVPEKVVLEGSYNLSSSDMDINNFNPNGVSALTLQNAVATPWPRISNLLHEASADLSYRITPNVRAGARYLFAWYDLDDFAWDQLQPYMAGVSAENTTRFVFADATYLYYRAHVGSVYLAGRF